MYDQSNVSRFDDLLHSGKKIFVLNNTEPKGVLCTTIHDPISGKSHKLEFPRTWIPFCLTSMLPRNVLEHNIEIRRTLANNTLKIVEESEALALLNTQRGKEEYDRLTKSQFSAGSSKHNEQKASLLSALSYSQKDLNSIENPNVEKENLTLHPKMQAWEQRVMVGDLDNATLINDLEIHSNELTESDLEYLVTGQFPAEVKSYAQERLTTGTYRFGKDKRSAIPSNQYHDGGDWAQV